MAHSSLRFGIGRFTTEEEIDFVVKHIVGTVNRLRDMRYVIRVYFRNSCLTDDALLFFLFFFFSALCGRWSKRGLISTLSIGLRLSTDSSRLN